MNEKGNFLGLMITFSIILRKEATSKKFMYKLTEYHYEGSTKAHQQTTVGISGEIYKFQKLAQ